MSARVTLNPGHRSGRLTVREFVGIENRLSMWLCDCDCGASKAVAGHALKSGRAKSCGCLRSEIIGALRRTHGMTNSREHTTWMAMLTRCERPSKDDAHLYRDRGITVCARWKTFENFLADMGPRPPGTSLDRINPELGYEPANCRWADARTQGRNRRNIKINAAGACIIRHLIRRGERIKDIAAAFGVRRDAITNVRVERTWAGAVASLADGSAFQ